MSIESFSEQRRHLWVEVFIQSRVGGACKTQGPTNAQPFRKLIGGSREIDITVADMALKAFDERFLTFKNPLAAPFAEWSRQQIEQQAVTANDTSN